VRWLLCFVCSYTALVIYNEKHITTNNSVIIKKKTITKPEGSSITCVVSEKELAHKEKQVKSMILVLYVLWLVKSTSKSLFFFLNQTCSVSIVELCLTEVSKKKIL